ncbi:g9111 [Coccomyxa elongata]
MEDWGGSLGRRQQRSLVTKAVEFKESTAVGTSDEVWEVDNEEEFEDGPDDGEGLTTQQVQSLLHVLCDETELAELELKMGSFEMLVRRSTKGGSTSASSNGAFSNGAITAPPPASAFASTQSMDIPAGDYPAAQSVSVSSIDEDIDDESTIFLTAPKVGLMRRGRYVKGKKVGKGNIINNGDEVKKGQTLGFIEQLGTYVPVESPQAGEIVDFLVEEGTAVEYNQPIVELMPFFGGHIIGDRKHA